MWTQDTLTRKQCNAHSSRTTEKGRAKVSTPSMNLARDLDDTTGKEKRDGTPRRGNARSAHDNNVWENREGKRTAQRRLAGVWQAGNEGRVGLKGMQRKLFHCFGGGRRPHPISQAWQLHYAAPGGPAGHGRGRQRGGLTSATDWVESCWQLFETIAFPIHIVLMSNECELVTEGCMRH